MELLTVISIIGLLAALLLPSLARARASARTLQCLSQMRQIALAIRLYAEDNADTLPRSQHSAFAHGQVPWGKAIAPGLGSNTSAWTNLLQTTYRCPTDKRSGPWSYGMNVYFELGPGDDYADNPKTWRRLIDVPNPANTVLMAESATSADHIMAHFWSQQSDAEDVDSSRHGWKSNYNFVDGHSQLLPLDKTYRPPGIDLWRPQE